MSSELPETRPGGRKVFFREAICRALAEEMERDRRVIVLGQDVAGYGGAYRETFGLFQRFGPERVRNTPVAEQAMTAVGVGAAAAGLRPVVCITYMDFLMLGLDPLVNYAAKVRYKTAGQLTCPLVVKTTAGAKGQGVAHSQCLEAWLVSVPGLKVVAPSTAADAYGLLKAAIRDDGPVVYVDHKRLFSTTGNVPTEQAPAVLGQAALRRRGSDVTIVGYSYMVSVALAAAERLAGAGVSCEVIDLRTLSPLDADTVCKSVEKTGALLTVEEGQAACGVGTELAFRVREGVPLAKVTRVASLPAPVSSCPVLEACIVPDEDRVIEATRRLLSSSPASVDPT
jgi:pyruvate/2-oxoglutarate/acetoin dehydrogenase E1 component